MVKIDLGDNDWAEVYPALTHRASKELRKHLIATIGQAEFETLQKKLEAEKDVEARKAIIKAMVVEGEDEIIVLCQTARWSFGEVSQAVLETIDERKFQKLAMEVEKLQSPIPLAGTNSLQGLP